MISPKYIILFLLGCMALVWACRPSESPDKAASNITRAFENNELDAARSLADEFFSSDTKLDTVSVPHLCMLSITMAKLSLNSEHADDYAALALNCYRVAMRRDSVTTQSFYSALAPEDYQYLNLLLRLGGSADVRSVGIYPDEEDAENPDMQ